MQTVYIIDADSAIRDAFTTLLESFNLSVEAYSDSNSFLDAVRGAPAGCVLVEAELPGLNGLGLLRKLRNKGNTIPVVLLTNNKDADFVERAEHAGAAGVLEKPFVSDQLVDQLRSLVGHETWINMTLPPAGKKILPTALD